MSSELEYYVNQYERFSKANKYEVYFLHKKELYSVLVKKLDVEMIRVTTESSKRGKGKKLKIYLNNTKKAQLIEMGAKKLMSENDFIDLAQKLGYNKGQTCEYLATISRGLEYKLDNVRFDKAGDVEVGRSKIQVKFENASIVNFSTIDKLVSNS